MDRDNRWDRTEAAYNLVTQNQAQYSANSAIEALENGYKREENDEFISPTTINIGEEIKINNADTIVFLNFRSDRARQFTNSILDENFNKFKRSYIAKDINYFTLTEHDSSQKKAIPIFETIEINNSLGEIVAKSGKTQLRIAETEKYPHVTFFFNGGEETIYPGEDRILIPSPKVETYDLKPEMSAYELTEKLNEALQSEKYDLIVCNYANGDMVGHTGNINAVIKSIEVLDKCLGKVLETVKSLDVKLLITADHGNAELMLDEKNNQPHTQHTINPVPFLYVGSKVTIRDGGNLSDIAPTILTLMNEKIPEEMTGKNLIIN
jgi:2,3-bisphosphoglycerate-independent phosphoglycerate mutase